MEIALGGPGQIGAALYFVAADSEAPVTEVGGEHVSIALNQRKERPGARVTQQGPASGSGVMGSVEPHRPDGEVGLIEGLDVPDASAAAAGGKRSPR